MDELVYLQQHSTQQGPVLQFWALEKYSYYVRSTNRKYYIRYTRFPLFYWSHMAVVSYCSFFLAGLYCKLIQIQIKPAAIAILTLSDALKQWTILNTTAPSKSFFSHITSTDSDPGSAAVRGACGAACSAEAVLNPGQRRLTYLKAHPANGSTTNALSSVLFIFTYIKAPLSHSIQAFRTDATRVVI